MIDFQRPELSRRMEYEAVFHRYGSRGCEYSLANLYMWGRQTVAFLDGCLVALSHYHGKSVYPFPVGSGDLRNAVDQVMADARERGIPCRLTCLTAEDVRQLEE